MMKNLHYGLSERAQHKGRGIWGKMCYKSALPSTDCPSTPLDNLWNPIYLATEALSDYEFISLMQINLSIYLSILTSPPVCPTQLLTGRSTLHLIQSLATVWVKKVAPQNFLWYYLLVNLCNWKLPWLLPKHIPMSTPVLVHLSEYLCKIYHFYWCDPSNFKNSV